MSEKTNASAATLPVPAESSPARLEAVGSESKDAAGTTGDVEDQQIVKAGAPDKNPAEELAPGTAEAPNKTNEKEALSEATHDKPLVIQEDAGNMVKTKFSNAPYPHAREGEESVDASAATPGSAKAKARRKSTGVPEHKNKKLSKKVSKAKLTHTDAKPGDYFYIKLKGYPQWPGIVCDESMLPEVMMRTRLISAAKPDGTYRPEYEDGGAKADGRSFPVMFFHTNEFAWVTNTDLLDLDLETVGEIKGPMRKDLQAAHLIAAEKHDLEYYKDILRNFMEARQADLEARETAKAAKKAAKTKRKSKATADEDEDGDVGMADTSVLADSEEADGAAVEKSNKKKRKQPDDSNTPQTDSVKKPRPTIKLTNTPKATNGVGTPKTVKDPSSAKPAKSPKKKAAPKVKATLEAVAPKEPDLTPEEKRMKKEKEILFLRHKLQKGMLTRDQEPKEEEMKQMSEFVTKLEGYADLEVSIIRGTKINKVLKAILKLNHIPKEEEFKFKSRSQTLLDKWNKLLASEQGTPAAATTTNGASPAKVNTEEAKGAPAATSNGVKESSEARADDSAPAKAGDVEAGGGNSAPAEYEDTKEKIMETIEAIA